MDDNRSVYGIGTLLEIEQTLQLVVGYRMLNENDHLSLRYLVIPYPLGFMSLDSLALVQDNPGYKVVSEGYSTDSRASYIQMLAKAAETGKSTSPDVYYAAMDTLLDARLGGRG